MTVRVSSAVFTALLLGAMIAPASIGAQASSEPLADVNGDVITSEDLEQALGARLSQLQEQVYSLKRRELENLVAQRLLAQEAAKRGMSLPALLDAEVTAKVGLVTEKEVDEFYRANKSRLQGDEATGRERVRAHLQQEKLSSRRAQLVESLRARGHVIVRLQPPPVVRVKVSTDGAPVRGAAEAPVTLVEFSDFQCPFCKQAVATLKQILQRYPGKVRLVYRDFPIDGLHPQARGAAEAARCAGDQGKFWEYHDAVYTGAPNAGPDDLRRYAEQTALDVPRFERCVSGRTHQAAVQRDIEEGTRLGVTGTPAFFVNGRPVVGAQPLDVFAKVIEDELTRHDSAATGPK